jgi:simple sugar transport system substrate-binding protein
MSEKSSEKMNRRNALTLIAAAGGLAVGAAGGYLLKPEAPAAGTATATVTETALTTAASAPPKYRFILVSGTPSIFFFGITATGVEDAGKLLNVKAEYYGPDEMTEEKWANLVVAAVAAKPDGLAISFQGSPESVDEPLRKAAAEGTPIIFSNTGDPRPSEQQIPHLCFIGMDNNLCGKASAEYVFAKSTPKRVMISNQAPGWPGGQMRAKGFTDFCDTKGVPWEQVDVTGDLSKAIEITRSYVEAHPQTDCIYSVGGLGTIAIGKLMETYPQYRGKIIGIGANDIPEILKPINQGYLTAGVGQQPWIQGFLPILMLYLYKIGGHVVQGDMLTGPFIIDKSNVEWYTRMHYPDKADDILS